MAEEIKAVKLKTRETEDTLYYKVQADECRKELNEAEHKLYNATQQIESMVEEKKSLMTTIVNKNKHILETENKETEDKLCYKDQADEYRKELNEAQYNLYNATQQIESMVEEKKSLMTTIVNKNKHILESENKAAESAEDARAAIDWYTATNTRFKDEIHEVKKKSVKIQREKDHLQEQLKIKDAEAQDQRKMIDHLKKKIAEVENENDINAKSAEMFHRGNNFCEQQLNATMMQSEKEKITSQRTITNLQNNIRELSEELKESKKSVIKKEAEKITSQRNVTKLQCRLRIVSEELRYSRKSVINSEKEKIVTITKWQTDSWNLFKELNDLKTRFLSMTDKLQEAEQRVIDLTKTIDLQNQDTVTASAKLDKLEKENEYLVNQLRSNETKIELLHTSHETERNKHKSAMKRMHARCAENEIELEKHKNAHFDLLLQIERVHNYSKISMEEKALFDKTFIEQKLEDERAKEEELAEVTTNIIKKFASAKDRHGVIKSFQKRFEKGSCPSPFGNKFLSDEDSHMERFPTAIHEHRDNKQYNERLEESKTTKNCHNKTEKNTNVFNISMNIAKSNVSFIDKKEERTLRLNGGSSGHKAIEGKEQL